ncbi:hypothetical protein BGX31_001678 [Mortierella sp. GBA43]|nr:hypothetical protein BGX31_001678 [Mortierella sp. GBA43]
MESITIRSTKFSINEKDPKPPCGIKKEFKSVETVRKHIETCAICFPPPEDSVPQKKQKSASEADSQIESASLQAGGILEGFFGEERFELSGTSVSRKLSGFFHLTALLRLVSNFPARVDPTTHVEWNDSNLGIQCLFDDWVTPGLQMVWTLLLVDVIFIHPAQSFRGLVVETYDRNRQRDYFGEHTTKKTPSSAPDAFSRYKLIKVSSRPTKFGNSMITLGTKQMNAIFTKVVYQVDNGPHSMDIGQSAGAHVFQPQAFTRVFLSRDSIKAAEGFCKTQSESLPPLTQLRCIFSHFSHVSAYFPARAGLAGELLPFTLFTLESFKLFEKVASAMRTSPSAAVLTREDVTNLNPTTDLHRRICNSLLEAFGDKDKLSIASLNNVLEAAAKELRADVRRANDARFKFASASASASASSSISDLSVEQM